MKALVLIGIVVTFLGGCATALYRPVEAQKVIARPTAQVYEDAKRAMRDMGVLTFASQTEGTITGTVKDVVALHVQILPHTQGSILAVHGKVLPNKIAVGKFTEVHDYVERVERATP